MPTLDPELSDAAARLVRRTCAEQNLPVVVTDVATLHHVATLCTVPTSGEFDDAA